MITEAQLQEICNRMAEGKSLRAVCRELDFAESSVRYWLNKSEEAFAHSARARELGCDALADECLEIADDDTIKAEDRRIRIDTRIRLIGKWSQRYSDKLTVKSESTVTVKHDLDALDTGELEQLETLLAKSERRSGGAGEAVASSVH